MASSEGRGSAIEEELEQQQEEVEQQEEEQEEDDDLADDEADEQPSKKPKQPRQFNKPVAAKNARTHITKCVERSERELDQQFSRCEGGVKVTRFSVYVVTAPISRPLKDRSRPVKTTFVRTGSAHVMRSDDPVGKLTLHPVANQFKDFIVQLHNDSDK